MLDYYRITGVYSSKNDKVKAHNDANDTKTTGGTKWDEAKYDTRALRLWLENDVKLIQYFDTFIAAGYESIEFVIEINHVNQLTEIGIQLPGHQMKIMAEIRKLRNVRDNEMEGNMIPHQGGIALEYEGNAHNNEHERKLSQTKCMNKVHDNEETHNESSTMM